MYNLDSLSLKYLIEENKDFLTGAVAQKIQMPSKREIILNLRNLGENKKLYINLDPKFPHLHLVTKQRNFKIPNSPPMFCMLLRKHLEGAKIKEIRVVEYERIVELYFDVYDEIGSLTPVCLSLEFMGKHSNAILYNVSNKIIIGCVHNISPQKSSVREVWGGVKYIYPPKQEKTDILKASFSDFYNLETSAIPASYYYLSGGTVDFMLFKLSCGGEIKKEQLFSCLQNLVYSGLPEIKEFWELNIKSDTETRFLEAQEASLNGLIEEYFSYFVMKNSLDTKKASIEKLLNKEIKRNKGTLKSGAGLNSAKAETYKQKGDLILANIYKINPGDKALKIDGVEIALDPTKTPSQNAQRYFHLYNKEKTAYKVFEDRKNKSLAELSYLEDILFQTKNADSIDVLDEIEDELSPLLGSQNSAGKSSKTSGIPGFKTLEYQGFTVYLGKNNKQNDYLIKKVSSPEDIWLHAANCPSSHVFIKTENGKKPITDEVLLYSAKLVKDNSPLKNTAKAAIIYTKRKYLKRPPDTHLGYVTYSKEREIVV